MKNIMIVGDSYSTFVGYVPKGYDIYYGCNEQTDVTAVEETWWYELMQEKGLNIIRNDSWSGSTIGYTGYNGMDNSTTSSFICRIEKYIKSGFFKENKIDNMIVFGGTNDFWSGAPVGELQYGDFSREDLYEVLPATCKLMELLKENLKDTKFLWVINSELSEKITNDTIIACEHYGIEWLLLKDIEKMCGHPSVEGMKKIKQQIGERL